MISVSRLLCDTISPGDSLRYGPQGVAGAHAGGRGGNVPGPVVVWNCTRRCNLRCIHCYASALDRKDPAELDTAQGKKLIGDLADFKVPVILFSGGEPLLRDDIFELAGFASRKGLRLALSTNGTLIDAEKARRIKDTGFAEVGISLDGIGAANDRFRRAKGAYRAALQGIRNCLALGIRASLRMTITRFNHNQVSAIFGLAEAEGIDRLCFYHLAYSGRGGSLQEEDLTHHQARSIVDEIFLNTLDLHKRGLSKEVLTVGNHADGVYLYLKLLKEDPGRAGRVMELLKTNGGNNSGIRIGCIDDVGEVHPDQFWMHYSLGNVTKRKFGDIWKDPSEPLMQGLRERKKLLKGRCARCRYLDLCNGSLRVRAEAVHGDIWAEDPACYLTEAEIGI
ncbi:MAG: radical SAM protein [Dehalococcoidia bacterium]|jgi:radical SAM protein with 4Fe4S-binding SPASM domain